jgi:hypothetical protein
MIVDILISAPSDKSQLTFWGDYHFALALGTALEKLSVSYNILYADTHIYHEPNDGSVLLTLRGKHGFNKERWPHHKKYKRKLLWIISWPSRVKENEVTQYDHIFVASTLFSNKLKSSFGKKVSTLLQCTDFSLKESAYACKQRGILFIGNTRGKQRPLISAFSNFGVPMEVIGNGWQELGIYASRKMISNSELPMMYSNCLAVLNDHHSDMAEYGFLNNRIFDVLACSTPIITDMSSDCPAEARSGVIDMNLENLSIPEAIERAIALQCAKSSLVAIQEYIHTYHSFDARAKQIASQIFG